MIYYDIEFLHGKVISMKKFFSVKEVAELLGVSRSLIYYRIRKKYIPSRRVGRRILIPSSYIMRIRIV